MNDKDRAISTAVVKYWLAHGDLSRTPDHVRFHIGQLCAPLVGDRAKLEEASPEMLEAGYSYIRSFGGLISTLELPGLYRAMVAALNKSTDR